MYKKDLVGPSIHANTLLRMLAIRLAVILSYNIAKEVHFSTLFRVEVQAVKRPHQRNPRSPGRTPSRIRETCACVRRVRVTNMSSALPRLAYLGSAKLRSET